jgi:hypothetical protein
MNSASLNRIAGAACVGALMIAGSACNRNAAVPEVPRTTGLQQRMDPITVAGCLRAGEAENTFVLTAAAADPNSKSATYQLIGYDVPLRDYVGQQVEVEGTLRAEEAVATDGVSVQKPKKGAEGTPTVETKTELDVRQMTVSSVKPSGQRCAPGLPSENQPAKRIK